MPTQPLINKSNIGAVFDFGEGVFVNGWKGLRRLPLTKRVNARYWPLCLRPLVACDKGRAPVLLSVALPQRRTSPFNSNLCFPLQGALGQKPTIDRRNGHHHENLLWWIGHQKCIIPHLNMQDKMPRCISDTSWMSSDVEGGSPRVSSFFMTFTIGENVKLSDPNPAHGPGRGSGKPRNVSIRSSAGCTSVSTNPLIRLVTSGYDWLARIVECKLIQGHHKPPCGHFSDCSTTVLTWVFCLTAS